MSSGIFAGSFDPFTNGHMYIVKLASRLFDRLIICIATNEAKTRTFSKELMKCGIEETLKANGIYNCEVVCYDGYITDLAKKEKVDFVIRGMRQASEFDYEEKLASVYYKEGNLETIYVGSGSHVGSGILKNTSSTLVRNLIKDGKPISDYVPKEIEELITNTSKTP